MKRNAAFTVRELLVVLAIVGIVVVLAILATPNIICGPVDAYSVTDAANLSSIGKGVQRYLIDHDDKFFTSDSSVTWPEALNHYLNDWRVFKSPFDKRSGRSSAPYPVSYGVNKNCMNTSAAQWTAPMHLIVMADQKVAEKGANQFTGLSTQNPILQPGQGLGVYKSGKMLNCLFGDYHAVAISIADFRDVQSEKGRERWVPAAER